MEWRPYIPGLFPSAAGSRGASLKAIWLAEEDLVLVGLVTGELRVELDHGLLNWLPSGLVVAVVVWAPSDLEECRARGKTKAFWCALAVVGETEALCGAEPVGVRDAAGEVASGESGGEVAGDDETGGGEVDGKGTVGASVGSEGLRFSILSEFHLIGFRPGLALCALLAPFPPWPSSRDGLSSSSRPGDASGERLNGCWGISSPGVG